MMADVSSLDYVNNWRSTRASKKGDMTVTCRLAAILTIDVAGYSHLLGANEKGDLILAATRRLADEVGYSGLIRAGAEGMFERLNAHRRQLVDPKIAEHHGRILKTTGDRTLVEFPGPVEAVRCAVEMQRAMAERNADTVADKRITFCVGVDLGNLSADGDPIDRDRVAAAVSLEALAEPGGICISHTVHDLIRDKLPYTFKDIGEQRGKNMAMPVRAYAMSADAVASISEVTAKPEPVLAPRRFSTRSAVIAASVAATIGVCTAAWWAWLGGSSSTAPTQQLVAAGPQISPENATAVDTSAADKGAQAPPRPTLSIVVLPFANLSGDPDQEYFADGITEDLIADVSRFPGSFVVARNTAFTYKGQPVDARQVGHDLGVRYVIEGGVQRAGEQVRLNAQLIDTETGARPWAEQIDTDRINFADAQNGLIGHLARTLDPQLVPISAAQIALKTVDPDARELIMRGRGWSSRPYSAATWQEAQRAFERALEIDSRSVEARVGLAGVLGGKLADGWSSSRQQDPARAEQLLREALERDANRSTALCDGGAPSDAEPTDRSAERVRDGDQAQSQRHARVLPAWPNADVPRPPGGWNSRYRASDPARSAGSEYAYPVLGAGRLSSSSRPGGSGDRVSRKSTRREFSTLVSSPVRRWGVWPAGRCRAGKGRSGRVDHTKTRDQLGGSNARLQRLDHQS